MIKIKNAFAGSKQSTLIGSYPPMKCGIAFYNQQLVNACHQRINILKIDEINVLAKNVISLIKLAIKSDCIVYSYVESGLGRNRFQRWFIFFLFIFIGFMFCELRIIFHEPWPIASHNKMKLFGKLFFRIVVPIFHSEAQLKKTFLRNLNSKKYLTDHGSTFKKYFFGTKKEARNKFNMSETDIIFLCIGFITETKGFHLFAEEFFKYIDFPINFKLYIVGSVRFSNSIDSQILKVLDKINSRSKGKIIFVNKFIDNEEFDLYIQASDVVVLPYLKASGSGIMERAKLFEKDLLIKNLPELVSVCENYTKNVIIYDSTFPLAELKKIYIK